MEALGLIEAVGVWVAIDLMGRDTLGSKMADGANEAEEVDGADEAEGANEVDGADEAEGADKADGADEAKGANKAGEADEAEEALTGQ